MTAPRFDHASALDTIFPTLFLLGVGLFKLGGWLRRGGAS